MPTRLAIAAVTILVVAALLAPRTDRVAPRRDAPTARPIRVLPPDSAIAGPVIEERTVGAYTIQVLTDSAAHERIVDVKQNGHRVFAVRAADARLELVGTDITGDKVPDVVIQAFSGGMHCCSQATILSLGDSLRLAGVIDGADGEIEFADIDGDGIPEAKVGDWRFAYWRDYSFSDTPVPEVVLKAEPGGYHVACALMRERAPDQAALTRKAKALTRDWETGDPPTEFWGYAVDLIYAGNPDQAWQFLDLGWPASISGKEEFVSALREKLRGSPCWSPPPAGGPAT